MQVVPFNFESTTLRVVTGENGEPLFVGKDLCDALGYKDSTTAIRNHCKGVPKQHPLQTPGGKQVALSKPKQAPQALPGPKVLTHIRLLELLSYDPYSGLFKWRIHRKNSTPVGSISGSPTCKGYVGITVDGKQLVAHRLAWFYINGEWPSGQIDHINGIKADNRISNLRVVTNSVNQQNKKSARADNKTGILGVHLHYSGKYQAKINIGGRQRSLGMYLSAADAQAAYIEAKREYHDGCTI